MPTSSNTSRIAKNTLLLYFRQILIMLVSLYTVRIVLNVLGAEDYGIYNVVAGVVTMFGFLSSAMSTATQRYFAFDLGKQDYEHLKTTFSVTVTIYFLLIIVVVIIAETVGLWFINNRLSVPMERLVAAKWIYQFALLSFVFTLLTTPYMSAIIAHENMNVYAYVSIVEAVLKLALVFVLQIIDYDKLILYGILMLAVAVINTSLYRIYCKRKYDECKLKFIWDRKLFREMLGFTGWTLFGAFTTVARNQAITVLFNQFFTPVIVAARSISLQITNAVGVFSTNFNKSLYPPIIKEYSAGNRDGMYSLLYNGCKMTFFLMWVFSLPIILNMKTILSIWLEEVPEWTVFFSQLALIEVLVNSLSMPITVAARAPGRMKTYELTLGILQLCIFFVSWILFQIGYDAWVSFVAAIVVNVIMMVVRLVIVRGLVGLPLKQFTVKTILPISYMAFASLSPALLMFFLMPEGVLSSIIQVAISVPLTCIAMYYLGMTAQQRTQTVQMLKNKLFKE
ncbi:MAG: oligosaccharide flippase family protein [Bacteroidales bacterium]|nr:oligosaccharide flippase family protein [Bacteroidales bacterium]